MITKKCVECDKDFSIKIKEGSGGSACLRRKYCSESCKRSWKLKNGKNNFILVKCDICLKDILKFPSLVKDKNFCSKKCLLLNLNGVQKTDVKTCLVCQSEFKIIVTNTKSNNKKYCSYECFKTVEKKKTGKMLSCLNCNKKFYSNKHELSRRKYCSNPCQFESQSKGIKRIATNGRSGFRKDLPEDQYFKSSLEADYARFLIKQNIAYEYEKYTFKVIVDSKEVFYTPDFYIPSQDRFIELKGARDKIKYNKNLKSVESLSKAGKNIDIIYMNEFYQYLRSTGLYATMFLEVKNYKKSKDIIRSKNEN